MHGFCLRLVHRYRGHRNWAEWDSSRPRARLEVKAVGASSVSIVISINAADSHDRTTYGDELSPQWPVPELLGNR